MTHISIHPAEILGEELEAIEVSAKQLAEILEVPPARLHQILVGNRRMAADLALRLSRYFQMSAEFWMNLQSAHRLDRARQELGNAIERIAQRGRSAA